MGFMDKMKDAANQASKATGMGTGMGIGEWPRSSRRR